MLYVPLCKLARALHRPPLTSLISVTESIGNSRRLLRAVSEALERSFYAIGHGLLIPLFFVSIGLSSDYRALAGHWKFMLVVLFVAVIGKLFGCGLAALASGMDWVRSLRIGCGMISRGEVGLIVTAMGAASGIFGKSEVAVMVGVVLLTTLLTPIALRGAFHLKCAEDYYIDDG